MALTGDFLLLCTKNENDFFTLRRKEFIQTLLTLYKLYDNIYTERNTNTHKKKERMITMKITVVKTNEVVDHFSDDNDTCYVERIDVDEAFRGHGIGTEVLTSTLWNECGYRYVVVAPDNEDAQRLYERIGEEYNFIPGCDQDFGYNDQGYGVYVI